MVDELWDDLIDEHVDFYTRLLSLHPLLELGADLAGEAAEELVAPADQLLPGSLKAVS